MKDQEKQMTLARIWMEKAHDALSSARIECNAGQYAFAINRLYYAVFYAVSSACAAEGREYGKHTAVRAAFNKDFVATGRVPAEMGKLFNRLFDDRQEADYAPLRNFVVEDVKDRFELVEEFLHLFEDLLK